VTTRLPQADLLLCERGDIDAYGATNATAVAFSRPGTDHAAEPSALLAVHARRAFTVIATMPGHLLPGWEEEWRDLLPHWHVAGELRSPSDVSAFFRGAQADSHTPRIAFVRNTSLSLGSGYTCGAEDRESGSALRLAQAIPEEWQELDREALLRTRKARSKAARQTQEEVAATDDGADVDTPRVYPRGVSARTIRRDAVFRATRPFTRFGQCCPRCGRPALDSKLQTLTRARLYARGVGAKAACEHCGEILGQFSRRWDNTSDRELPLWDSPAWTTHAYDADGNRSIPWGERPMSNPRYPLGKLIGKRYRGLLDLFLCDEAHKTKAAESAIGQAMGYMVRAAHRTVCLTGTLFGGRASDVYSLLLRAGNIPVLRQWGWGNQAQFVSDVGITEEITRTSVSETTGHGSGKVSVSTRTEERPGITAALAMILQNAGPTILLKHMGFNLVSYTEELITLDMPADLAVEYRRLEAAGKAIIPFDGADALGSYLQSTLLYPYAPWKPKTIASKRKGEDYTPPAFASDLVLPHHTWLASYCAEQVRQGRRVLIYAEHTGTDNVLPDIASKIARIAAVEHGVTLRPACLYSTTVATDERRDWFQAREGDGTNVVLCNPRLVETGLNLIGWPSIVVLEPIYSLFTLAQAKRRAFRPTQTKPCEVTFVCYAGTMSEQAISIVARKSAAAAILTGDDLSGGLMEFDAGMSLFKELAKAVLKGETGAVHADVRAMLAAGAQALKAELEAGTRGMLGIPDGAHTLALPPAQLDLPTPVPLAPVPSHAPGTQPGVRRTTLLVFGQSLAQARRKPAPPVATEGQLGLW
jgi:hypothetical protein